MSAFKIDAANEEVARAGLRGIQQMRRSRSTGALGKVRGRVGQAKEYINKQAFETQSFRGKVFNCALGSLGLDLSMLPPGGTVCKLDLSVSQKPIAKVGDLSARKNVKPFVSQPAKMAKQLPVASANLHVAVKTECSEALGPCEVEGSSGAWTFFSNDIQSYEELYNMVGDSHQTQVLQNINCVCRRFYCNEIQFYEDLYFLAVGDKDQFDDELVRRGGKSSKRSDCRFFFCNDIHSYEEFFNIARDDLAEFDDVYFSTLVAEAESTNLDCQYFYCNAIHSYEELYNFCGEDDQLLDDEVVAHETSTSSHRSFYCREIHSYEEFYNLVGSDGEELDGDNWQTMNSMDRDSVTQRSFFGKHIHAYEELYNLVGGVLEKFDDEVVI